MSRYSNMTIQEICDFGVKKKLEKKPSQEWTDYDAALAYIHGVSIPDGKMPTELLIKALKTADKYAALNLIKRPEAEEYREEAINLFIERYCNNWINRYLSGDRLKTCDNLLEEAKRSLKKTICMWLYSGNIVITWNNIARFFQQVAPMNRVTAKGMIQHMSKAYGEKIPNYITEMVEQMPE